MSIATEVKLKELQRRIEDLEVLVAKLADKQERPPLSLKSVQRG